MKLKKLTLAMALAAAVPTLAHAGPFVFDPLAGNAFEFSSLVLSTASASSISLTDTNGNGVVDSTFTDTFIETGAVYGVNFKNLVNGSEQNVNPFVSGINGSYQLWAVYTPPAGALGGVGALVNGSFVGVFSALSSFTLFYDTNTGDQEFNLVDSTAIATGTNASGNCVLPQFGQAEGTCEISFQFNTLVSGLFSTAGNGIDFADWSKVYVNLDFNVDETNPAFTENYSQAGGTQVVAITHDGSARFQVPEPASLALTGLGLLGLGAIRRRKASV